MPAKILNAAATPSASFSSSDAHDGARLSSPIAESPRTSISENSNRAKPRATPREGASTTAEGVSDLLRACRAGMLTANNEAEKYTVSLSWKEYCQLCDILGLEVKSPSNFGSSIYDSVRWDYWADSNRFSIRMPAPTALHHRFLQRITDVVFDAAQAAGAGQNNLEPLVKLSSLAVRIPGKKRRSEGGEITRAPTSRVSPDNSIRPRSDDYPTFLLEVGFSNPRPEKTLKVGIEDHHL